MHPVVRGVDPLTLAIGKARAYGSPALMPVAQSAQGTPLVYVDDARSGACVVVTFGPAESNLASAPAFPVLMGNAIDWLVRPEVHRCAAGRPDLVQQDQRSSVNGPEARRYASRPPAAPISVFCADPGLYVVDAGASQSTFAVNVGDPQLSNVGRTTLGPRAGIRR